jgi:hypothetical protein
MNRQQVTLSPRQIAMALLDQFRQRFFESGKTAAKQTFNLLHRGESVPLMQISVANGGDISCELRLEDAQYNGRLNFSRFRRALNAHLLRLEQALTSTDELNIYQSDDFNGLVYNHPGAVEDDGRVNILLSGIQQIRPGVVAVHLFFVDPAILGRG